MRRTFAVLFILCCADLSAQVHSGRRIVPPLDIAPVPTDFAEFVAQTDLIVIGKVTATEQVVVDVGESAIPMAEHKISVSQVLRSKTGKAPGSLRVRQRGGAARISGLDVYADDREFRVFRIGDNYLLFLNRKDSTDIYNVTRGPSGALRIAADQIETTEGLRHTNQLAGTYKVPLAQLVQLIRTFSSAR